MRIQPTVVVGPVHSVVRAVYAHVLDLHDEHDVEQENDSHYERDHEHVETHS